MFNFEVTGLKPNTNYEIRAKLVTEFTGLNNKAIMVNLESNLSKQINIQTTCKYSKDINSITQEFRNECKGIYGPSSNGLVTLDNRNPNTTSWPFFLVPDPENCGCREMNNDEALEYCAKTFYSSKNLTKDDLRIVDGKCIEKVKVSGPVRELEAINLLVNQNVDDMGEPIPIIII